MIPSELRPRAGLGEIVAGVQILIPKELEERSVKGIASRLADHHHGAAVRPAIFGRIGIDVQAKLFHAVDDGVEGHLSGLGLQHADSVVEIFVGSGPASVDARKQRSAAGQSYAWGERQQGNEISAVQRQRGDFGFIDVIVYVRGGRLKQRRRGVHFHRFRGLPELQPGVEASFVGRVQNDAGLPVISEAGLLDA